MHPWQLGGETEEGEGRPGEEERGVRAIVLLRSSSSSSSRMCSEDLRLPETLCSSSLRAGEALISQMQRGDNGGWQLHLSVQGTTLRSGLSQQTLLQKLCGRTRNKKLETRTGLSLCQRKWLYIVRRAERYWVFENHMFFLVE